VIDPHRVLAFAGLAFALIVVPGPSVLFVISRGVALGRRAAFATVVGNTLGAATQVALVAAGLGAIVARSIVVFNVVKFAGAAYLIWLGVQAFRHRGDLARSAAVLDHAVAPKATRRIVREGFIVGVSNPKIIVFFAAVLPQFVDPNAGWVPVQMAILGLVFVTIALVSDSMWGLAAGTARTWLSRSPKRLERIGGIGGVVTVGLGLRLALTGRHD
jgi:threonine/homoserine/homoserine lactone efflux protein